VPPVASTKSLTGHALGAAGVHEAIFSMIMMEQSFIAPSINIDTLDEKAAGIPVVREMRHAELTTVMSNSFGFGGTNATLVMRKYK
jgi:3-oxoacyl-[acyl-carrier-protein] synthase-1